MRVFILILYFIIAMSTHLLTGVSIIFHGGRGERNRQGDKGFVISPTVRSSTYTLALSNQLLHQVMVIEVTTSKEYTLFCINYIFLVSCLGTRTHTDREREKLVLKKIVSSRYLAVVQLVS